MGVCESSVACPPRTMASRAASKFWDPLDALEVLELGPGADGDDSKIIGSIRHRKIEHNRANAMRFTDGGLHLRVRNNTCGGEIEVDSFTGCDLECQ